MLYIRQQRGGVHTQQKTDRKRGIIMPTSKPTVISKKRSIVRKGESYLKAQQMHQKRAEMIDFKEERKNNMGSQRRKKGV